MAQFLTAFAILVGVVSLASAQQSPPVDEAREAEVSQTAKKRLYPGGRDEEDLKVQAELVTPTRKVAPQAEVKEEHTEE